MLDEWRAVAAFIRRPTLPDAASGYNRHALIALLRVYALDIVLMGGLLLIAGLVMAAGVEFPRNTIRDLDMSLYWVAIILLGAPLLEEVAFRSWLSGRPGHIFAGLIAAASVLTIPFIREAGSNGMILGAGALAALIALIWTILRVNRTRGPFGWFNRAFPAIFWLVTLGFGAVHLSNYSEGNWLFMLPLVLPQVISGALFGYVRVHYGLWSSILLHMAHNGTALALFGIGVQLA